MSASLFEEKYWQDSQIIKNKECNLICGWLRNIKEN